MACQEHAISHPSCRVGRASNFVLHLSRAQQLKGVPSSPLSKSATNKVPKPFCLNSTSPCTKRLGYSFQVTQTILVRARPLETRPSGVVDILITHRLYCTYPPDPRGWRFAEELPDGHGQSTNAVLRSVDHLRQFSIPWRLAQRGIGNPSLGKVNLERTPALTMVLSGI